MYLMYYKQSKLNNQEGETALLQLIINFVQ